MSTITIQSFPITNAQATGATFYLRIYALSEFLTSANVPIPASSLGSRDLYKSIECNKSGTTITVPQFTLDSTEDALRNPNARYIAALYSQSGAMITILRQSFSVPTVLGSTINWGALMIYNDGATIANPPTTYLNAQEVARLITASSFTPGANEPFINVMLSPYSATGDGVTDDTTAIQAAANAAIGKTLYFPQGTFIVSQILLSSDTRVYLDPGSTVRMIGTADTAGGVFTLRDLTNVTIEGAGTIDGGKNQGALRSFGILVQGGSRFRFRDFTVQNADDTGQQRGDGIYLGVGFNEVTVPTDVVIDGITSTDNDRQAISVIGAKKLRIVNCTLKDTTGTDEGVGIDFEPNPDGRYVSDAVTIDGDNTVTSATANFQASDLLYNPQIIIDVPTGGTFVADITARNSAASIEVEPAPTFSLSGLTMRISRNYSIFEDIVVANNLITGNNGGGILLANPNRAQYKGIIFDGNIIRDNGRSGVILGGDMTDGLIFSNNVVSRHETNGLTLTSCNKGVTAIGNDIFDNGEDGMFISGSSHYTVTNNKIVRNGQRGVEIRTDTVPGSVGEAGVIAYNRIFNNSTESADTYDGIFVGERADDNAGIDISHNWIGNDVTINLTPTQRYGINYSGSGSANAENCASIFNTFLGNLSGKINSANNSFYNAEFGFGDYAEGKLRSLVFGMNGSTAIATNATQGFTVTAGMAGSPSGTPANPPPADGAVPSAINTTDKRIAFYDGSGWWESSGSLFGSAALDFGSINAQTAAELTITVTGAATGNRVTVTPSGAPETGLIWGAYVSDVNTVTVRLANITSGAIDPASRTWLVQVYK